MTQTEGDRVPTPPPDAAPSPPAAKSRIRNGLEWVAIIGGALVVAFLVKTFLFQAFYIPSESMMPTLRPNDRVLVAKLSYDLHGVRRGDLVVFNSPVAEGIDERDLIKRVVAIEGDTVEVRDDGRLLVNGVAIDEPYLGPGVTTSPLELTSVPADHVWVMGDNRPNSKDSRFFGALPEKLIIGRAFIRMWPLTSIRLL